MKLKKQFEDFYKEIKIDDEIEDLKEKREILEEDIKNKLPTEMEKHGITLKKSDIEIFDQGSYKLNTTISDKEGSIDRDVAVMFPLDKSENPDTRKIKGYVRDSLKHNNRTITIKEPCVNVSYAEGGVEWLHIDLPIYAKCDNTVYLARGRENSTEGNYGWEEADPKGLNDWQLNEINGNQQLRRIIRYIKKWKQEKYRNSTLDHEIPPSIGITLLAIDGFSSCNTEEGDDDLTSLQQTLQKMVNKFSLTYDGSGTIIKADISRLLPVKPFTDVFKKMKDCSDSYGIKFYNRLSVALQHLTDACNESSEHDAGISVQKVFGDDFQVPAKQATNSNASSQKEHNFG
ncbi:MAG TPA: hypothetical protein DDW50_03245 [Firmicutes bacterium]|jgi:hypothetical protein|nr:hypothetical protein [Bacillota bacterium]